jgi:nucleoid DNA-binding protein
MTQQELIGIVAEKIQTSVEKTTDVLEVILSILSEELVENGAVYIDDFGVFKTQKRSEYVSLNSKTGERLLMPPSIEIVFESILNDADTATVDGNTAVAADKTVATADNNVYVYDNVAVDNNVNRNDNSEVLFFEPDLSLRNSINSAFINFEATVLNEGVELPGIEVISDAQLSSDTPLSSEVSVVHEPTDESDAQFTIAEKIASQEDVKTHHTIKESPPVIDATPQVIKVAPTVIVTTPPVIDAAPPTLDAVPPIKQRSSNSRIWVPIMGGVAITLAALFFFNGTTQKKGK